MENTKQSKNKEIEEISAKGRKNNILINKQEEKIKNLKLLIKEEEYKLNIKDSEIESLNNIIKN